jgi:signal peptidase
MKILKKVGGIAAALLFAVMLAAGAAMIILRVFGYRLYAVQTASMQNVCPVGSVIIVKPVSPENIREGDIISFVADTRGTVVTHRVVKTDSEKQEFITKGDMNSTEDSSAVIFENLIGKVSADIPYIGFLLIFIQRHGVRKAIAAAAAVAAVLIVIQLILAIRRRRRNGSNRKEA